MNSQQLRRKQVKLKGSVLKENRAITYWLVGYYTSIHHDSQHQCPSCCCGIEILHLVINNELSERKEIYITVLMTRCLILPLKNIQVELYKYDAFKGQISSLSHTTILSNIAIICVFF